MKTWYDDKADRVLQRAPVEEAPTLLVTREVRESGNVFHVLTDMLNAFITLRMLGWEGQPRQVDTDVWLCLMGACEHVTLLVNSSRSAGSSVQGGVHVCSTGGVAGHPPACSAGWPVVSCGGRRRRRCAGVSMERLCRDRHVIKTPPPVGKGPGAAQALGLACMNVHAWRLPCIWW
jgi:hypothetical protein